MTFAMKDWVVTFLEEDGQAKCAGFAWDAFTLVSCAHAHLQNNTPFTFAGTVHTHEWVLLPHIREDVMFLRSHLPHGVPVLTRAQQLLHEKDGIYVMPQYHFGETTPTDGRYGTLWYPPKRVNMLKQLRMEQQTPLTYTYNIHDPRRSPPRQMDSYGASGSPVLNIHGDVVAMHVYTSLAEGLAGGVPITHMQTLWENTPRP